MSVLKRILLCVLHPFDCCDIIKRDDKRFRWYFTLIFYLLVTAVNYSYLFYVHFPLSIRRVSEANVLLEAGIVIFPHISWVVASYAMTAILDGESTFMQQLEAATYALTPVIVITPFLGLASRVLSGGEAGIYHLLYTATYLAVVVLLFLELMALNDYSFPKALLVTLLSVIAMIVMWAVLLLLYSLTVQLFTFFANLRSEFRMKALF